MRCEICGQKEASRKAMVEGVELLVCDGCGGYGTKVIELSAPRSKPKVIAPKLEESIVDGFGLLIKAAREKRGLDHAQFASLIKERESLVRHIETEHALPSMEIARKMERLLGIKLVEMVPTGEAHLAHAAGDQLTIGDRIKIRKR